MFSIQKLFILLLILFTFFIQTKITFAENDHKNFSITASGGIAIPQSERYDDGFYADVALRYAFSEFAEIGIESGYIEYALENQNTFLTSIFNRATGVPILATFKLNAPIELEALKLTPYILGGAGVTLWDYNNLKFIGLIPYTAFTAKAEAGLEIEFNDTFALFVEGGYFFSESSLESITLGGGGTLSF